MPITPATLALTGGMAALQGILAGSAAKAQYEQNMAAYRRELLQSWLDIDQRNFAAAVSNANQEMALEQLGTEAATRKGRSRAQLKEQLNSAFEVLSYQGRSQLDAARANVQARGAKGGSSEAVLRTMQNNAEDRMRETSKNLALQRRQIDEEYEQMIASAQLQLQGASSFIPGSEPTDNSMNAMMQGIVGGIQSGLKMSTTFGNLGAGAFKP